MSRSKLPKRKIGRYQATDYPFRLREGKVLIGMRMARSAAAPVAAGRR